MSDDRPAPGDAGPVAPDEVGGRARLCDVSPEGSSAKTRQVLTITTIVLIGTVLMIGRHYFLGSLFAGPSAHNTFLFRPVDRFMDFLNVFLRARGFIAGSSTVVDYTPWAQLIMSVLTPLRARFAFLLELFAFGVTLSFMLWRYFLIHLSGTAQKVQAFFILAALSYPVLFLVDRGNSEMIVFIFLFWFLHLYYTTRSPWAGVLLGAAIAMKFYPATLLILLIADRRYRDAIIAAVAAIAMFAAGTLGLSLLSGHSVGSVLGFTVKTLVGSQFQVIALSGHGVQHAHSLWGALTALVVLNGGSVAAVARFSFPYALFCLAVFAMVSAYVIFIERRDWAKVALLVMCAIGLPYVSADYTLIHLFLPMMLLVGAPWQRYDRAAVVTLALLFVPMDFVYILRESSTSVLIYPGLMVALTAFVVAGGLSARRTARKDVARA